MTSSFLKNAVLKIHQALKLAHGSSSAPANAAVTIPAEMDPIQLNAVRETVESLTSENTSIHQIVQQMPSRLHNPISFLDVAQTPLMSAVIIVLRPGHVIPLHDHPQMYGWVKVIHGKVRVKSYSILSESKVLGSDNINKWPALRMQDVLVTKVSEAQMLTPGSRNVHQIEYVSGEGEDEGKQYAAFFDLLSPPYNEDVGCHYFVSDESDAPKTSEGVGQVKCNLVEVNCPEEYKSSAFRL